MPLHLPAIPHHHWLTIGRYGHQFICIFHYNYTVQTLGDAAKVKGSKKRIPQQPSQCAAPTQVVPIKLPEVHSESFIKYKSELDIDRLKQPLTRESYVEKFHHLLCWEEKEHDDLLKQRYMHAKALYLSYIKKIDCIIGVQVYMK